MKIALLTEKYTPNIGGLAISTERLARLLTSIGHKVRVFCPSSNLLPSEKRIIPSNGLTLTRFGAHKRVDDTLVDWFELIVAEHQREPFDVLHAYFLTQAGFVATYAGKYLNIPSVVSIRGNDIERAAFDPSRFSHTMYALQNANAVTTNATELVKKAKAFIDREIILIPNGVDTELFKPMEKNLALAEALNLVSGGLPPSFREHPQHTGASSRIQNSVIGFLGELNYAQAAVPGGEDAASSHIPVIGFVGELREKKGLKTLLSAYALVNKKQPATLLIVGEVRAGEDKKVFDEFQITNPQCPIIVTGYISPKDLPAYYSLIDVFVHPSLRDGMPNAVLEAMACEEAVVATCVGGVSDVIKDSENGSTVPVNDAGSLSKAILELLNDPALRVRLGKSARATIQKEFTLQKELDANLHIYRQLGIQA